MYNRIINMGLEQRGITRREFLSEVIATGFLAGLPNPTNYNPAERTGQNFYFSDGTEVLNPNIGGTITQPAKDIFDIMGKGDIGANFSTHSTPSQPPEKVLLIKGCPRSDIVLMDHSNLPVCSYTLDDHGEATIALPTTPSFFGIRIHYPESNQKAILSLRSSDEETPTIDMSRKMRENPPRFGPIDSLTRKNVEQQFGIKTRTVKEICQQAGVTDYANFVKENYPSAKLHPGSPPEEWTNEQLALSGDYLRALPPHFLLPDPDGKPLIVTNLGAIRIDQTCHTTTCLPSDEEKEASTMQPFVLRESHIQVTLDPRVKGKGFEAITHEFIHRMDPHRIEQPDGSVLNKNSPWFTQMNKILGGDFSSLSAQYLQRLTPAMKRSKDLNNPNVLFFFQSIYYGLSSNPYFPTEFIPVLGQHYVHGKDFFTKMYTRIFPEGIAENLYDFVKQDIFKDFEYEHFPKF